jgi:hypothetical protein
VSGRQGSLRGVRHSLPSMLLDLVGSSVLGVVFGIWGHRHMGRRGMTLGFFGGGLAWLLVAAWLQAAFGG